MQSLLRRILLFIFSPILIFVFGDEQQVLHSKLKDDSNYNNKGFNSKLPYTNNPVTSQNISQALFTEFEELAHLSDVAYCVGYTGIQPPFKCLGRCSEFPTFQLVETWNTGPLLSDSCGYVALSHPPAPKRIIIAVRGTLSVTNAVADLSFKKQEYVPYPSDGHSSTPSEEKCDDCTVHAGFLESWTQAERLIGETVKSLVKVWKRERGYDLVIVGHSLGGAVACLAGLEFAAKGYGPIVTTFGEPKVGNEALARFIDSKFDPKTYRRLTHINDPIPLLPWEGWGFAPHKTEFYISKKEVPPTVEDIVQCEGSDDKRCIAGGAVNPFQILFSHRDYFVRVGICLPDPRKESLGEDVETGVGDEGSGGREIIPEYPNNIAERRRSRMRRG